MSLDLDGAEFAASAQLDHLQVFGNLSLAGTRFRGPVSFAQTAALGGLWGESAVFDGRCSAQGMEVHGRTWLVGARFDAAPGSPPRTSPGAPAQIRSHGRRWL